MQNLPPEISHYQFWKKLKDIIFIEKIILFGSRARGDFKERSDIDIAVVCPTASDRDWFQILEIVDSADTLLKIDCVRYDKLSEDDPLKIKINKEGIIIYGK